MAADAKDIDIWQMGIRPGWQMLRSVRGGMLELFFRKNASFLVAVQGI